MIAGVLPICRLPPRTKPAVYEAPKLIFNLPQVLLA
jgi:hypothetical protein